jgi:hypothetical protein
VPVTWTLQEPSRWPRKALAVLATLVLSAATAGIVVLANGNIGAAVGLPIGVGVVLAMVMYPRHTYAFLLFGTLLFEQYQIFGLDPPVTLQIPFFANFNNSIGVPLPTNPVECMMGLMGATFLLNLVVTRRFTFQRHPFQLPVLVFAGMLIAFVAKGIGTGGVANIAIWEVRALFYMVLAYFVGSQLVREHADVVRNTWCIFIPMAIKGFQGVWRYIVDLGGSMGDVPVLTSFVLTVALMLFEGEKGMVKFTLWTMPTTLITFIFSLRRVAWGCLIFGLVMLFVYLPKPKKMIFVKILLPLIPVMALYFAAFWNKTTGPGMLVQQVRSIFGEDATGEEDSSNTYRDDEKVNLIYTIKQHPLGRGFGQKYLIVVHLDEVDFPLWDYIPHNCILWLWAKTGFIGMVVFLSCIALIIIQCTLDFKTTTRPLYKALLVVMVVFWVVQVLVAYYDLQLTFYRNMVYIGAFMATLVPVHHEAKRNAALLEQGKPLPCP